MGNNRSSIRDNIELNPSKFIVPGVVMLAFLTLGTVLWRRAVRSWRCSSLATLAPRWASAWGCTRPCPRRENHWDAGCPCSWWEPFWWAFAAIYGQENMQIEGAFFGLLAGVFQAAVVHYLIAKIFGPMLFGRIWCGWACWTVMVLDLLPFKRPAGRLPGKWGWLRYLHFAVSLGLVAVAWVGFGFTEGAMGRSALAWYIVGNLFYYAIGIVLAYALKDNRAFCKYLCPVSVPLKITSRFALLKIGGEAEKCNDCKACVKMCPMDIRVPEYILNNQRVLSTECSLCQTCITVCAKDALKLSFGFDLGGLDLLREREQEKSLTRSTTKVQVR